MHRKLTLKKTLRILLAVASLALARGLFAQQMELEAKTPTIQSGEPLIISIVFRNNTDATMSGPAIARGTFNWVVRSPDGTEVERWRPGGDVAALFGPMPPGDTKTYLLVVGDTATIRQPGQYEMTLHHDWRDVSARVSFNVVASTQDSLSQRAQALHSDASVPGDEGAAAAEALASMTYAVPSSMFCDVMQANPYVTYAVLPRLEAAADGDAVHCLIRALSDDPWRRQEIQPLLERLAKSEKDPSLRMEIEQALPIPPK